jgi:hypothetical protein
MEFGIVLIFLVVLGVLIAHITVLLKFAAIAEAKGYDKGLFVVLGLFVSIAAYLLIIALPDLKGSQPAARAKAQADALPDL